MTIQNELNKIKSAVLGKDVRTAIHDSIEKTYNDATESGNANMEVEMARGTHLNLNDRLNVTDNKINVTDNKVDITKDSLNTRIDNIIATPTMVSEQEIMDARQGEISLGANIMAFKEEYTQLNGVDDDVVDGDLLTFVKKVESTNLLPLDGYIVDSVLSTSGIVTPSTDGPGVTGFIKVLPGMILTFQGSSGGVRGKREIVNVTAYDKWKKVLSTLGSSGVYTKDNKYLVPETVRYVRMTLWAGVNITNAKVLLSAVVNSETIIPYEPYSDQYVLSDNRYKLYADSIYDGFDYGGYNPKEIKWIVGTIENGIDSHFGIRFRSNTYFELNNENGGMVVCSNPSYKLGCFAYNKSDSSYVKMMVSGWSDKVYIPYNENYKYKLVGKRIDDATITEDDLLNNKIMLLDGIISGENFIRIDDSISIINKVIAINNGFIYVGNSKELYYEKSGSFVYIKTTDAICIRGKYTNKIFTWEQVTDMLTNGVFETSPLGVLGCLKMPDVSTLCYDVKTENIVLRTSYPNMLETDIVLFYNNYGSIGGELNNYRNRNMVETIKVLENRVNDLSTSGIPSYYKNEFVDTKNKLALLPKQNLNYIVITDIHNSNMPNSYCLSDGLSALTSLANSSNIDFVLYLGDSIAGGVGRSTKEQAIKEISEITTLLSECKKPVFIAFGNHDNNCFNAYSDVDTHYIFMDEWENITLYPLGLYDGSYYYKDIPNKNTRVIVLNTADYGINVDGNGNVTKTGAENSIRVEQLKWLATTLKETTTNMLICGHGIPIPLLDVLKAYQDRVSITLGGTVYDFSTNINEILLYNFGHYHMDVLEYSATYNLNMMCTTTGSMNTTQSDSYAQNPILTSWTRPTVRTVGTVLESAFDVVSIGEGKVNKIRFGAGEDDLLTM